MNNQTVPHDSGPKIYNLFPRLAGTVDHWYPHIERASDMGFNWLYINPFHPTGSSGSLYAIVDHFGFNPLFFGPVNHDNPEKELRKFLDEAHRLGLRVMADLVINHTAKQSPLVKEHPDWYKRDEEGHLIHPGAMHKGKMVYWRDLAEIDNLESPDRDALWNYWLSVSRHYLDLGFSGFRCDAAYQVPKDLWRFLIQALKAKSAGVTFFAETLGCSVDQTLDVARSGFEYIFNSFKWWDYQEPWFVDQHRRTRPVVPSVSFPESHDTARLAAELKDNLPQIKQRYLLSALITKGVMIPIGFEFGFHTRLNVKTTTAEDWEPVRIDLVEFIRQVNRLKDTHGIFMSETPLRMIPHPNKNISLLLKTIEGQEHCLLLINKSKGQKARLEIDLADVFPEPIGGIRDLSPERPLKKVPHVLDITLSPSEVKVLHHTR
ncbi:MAG: alpha-amylase family glycosyl hydrolase [bacterium]